MINPYINTSFVDNVSEEEMIAMWGIEGGVAKAKLDSMPIIQIVASRFKVEKVEAITVLATVPTRVAVTILEDKLVWIAAHKAKIIRRMIGERETKEFPRLVWR